MSQVPWDEEPFLIGVLACHSLIFVGILLARNHSNVLSAAFFVLCENLIESLPFMLHAMPEVS